MFAGEVLSLVMNQDLCEVYNVRVDFETRFFEFEAGLDSTESSVL